MDSKRKMIVAISAFAMVILATVVAIVAVLAASNVTVQSSVSVSYSVTDVVADAAVYAVKVKTNATSVDWGTAKGTANFTIADSTEDPITMSKFDLASDECLVLKFVFNNNSDKAFTATLTAPTAAANTNIYYSTYDVTNHASNSLLKSTTTSPTAVSVAAGNSASSTYYAVIKIADNTQDVTESSFNFNWTLA